MDKQNKRFINTKKDEPGCPIVYQTCTKEGAQHLSPKAETREYTIKHLKGTLPHINVFPAQEI